MFRGVELRRFPRIDMAVFVVGFSGMEQTLEGNISAGGIGFWFDKSAGLTVGDDVTVQLSIPEAEGVVHVPGIVRHIQVGEDDRWYAGVEFVNLDSMVEGPLFRYVEEKALVGHIETASAQEAQRKHTVSRIRAK